MPQGPTSALPPAVIVHGLAHARSALAPGRPVTLLSAPGAALYAGCLWWRALIEEATAGRPDPSVIDVLDCADASGRALAAIRAGQRGLCLCPTAPGFATIGAIAAERGLLLLAAPPAALDLARPDAPRRLLAWLGSA